MATQPLTKAVPAATGSRRRTPPELNILAVLLGIALIFELLGWILIGQSFLFNGQRLLVMILQVSVIGIIAVGVTQVIITGGVDLSSGSIVGLTAMVAASLAQQSDFARAVYPSLTGLPVIVPVAAGLLVGLAAGLVNGVLVAKTGIPPFIATLGMMVTARGLAKWYTRGQPVSMLTDSYATIGSSIWPVVIFLAVAILFHIALRYTRYGKFTYAIGANVQAARVSYGRGTTQLRDDHGRPDDLLRLEIADGGVVGHAGLLELEAGEGEIWRDVVHEREAWLGRGRIPRHPVKGAIGRARGHSVVGVGDRRGRGVGGDDMQREGLRILPADIGGLAGIGAENFQRTACLRVHFTVVAGCVAGAPDHQKGAQHAGEHSDGDRGGHHDLGERKACGASAAPTTVSVRCKNSHTARLFHSV